MVTCLIDNGAAKDIPNRLGKTPISRAFRYSHVPILEYFKSMDLSVPVVSMRLHTPSVASSGSFGSSNSSSSRATTILSNPNGSETETEELTNGDVVEVFSETIAGFYKLVDGRGYVLAANFIDATTNTSHCGVLVCKCGHKRPDEKFPRDTSIVHLRECKWTCCNEPFNVDLCPKGSKVTTPFTLGGFDQPSLGGSSQIPPPLFCPNKHPLAMVSRSARATCDVCTNSANKNNGPFSAGSNWCCQRCDYDICDECASVTHRTKGMTGLYYCGRQLGTSAIPGSDGQCGPNDGPQCKGCQAFSPSARKYRR